MNKQELIDSIQRYLNGKSLDADLDGTEGMDSLSSFYYRTAKRLVVSFELWKTNQKYWNDFLMALRDFLLVFETNLEISDVHIPNLNDFAIKKDLNTGKYYSTFQFPEGVISKFAEQAYMRNIPARKDPKSKYNLMTDSLIFSLTSFKSFKSLAQKIAVYGALNTPNGYTTLVSLPTGGGKSLITQTLAYQTNGLTIVVVPTVSLADDQAISAKNIIKGQDVEHEIFEYKSGVDTGPILKAIKMKTARLLFISPEALMSNQKFDEVINEANKHHYLRNIVIDEAHIVVDWGASFRVDYQCLESWRKKLMLSNPEIRTILLSATFEKKCVHVLKLLFSDGTKWIEVRCDALRHEPRYMLLEEKNYKKKDEKTVELVRKLPHPMIIYVAKPEDADRIQELLCRHGIYNVQKYTGLTKNEKRKELLVAWKENKFEIMIATSAFGVGVDKPDVRTVLHLYIPQNPNAYYQELGRGGRDQLPCLSVMCTYPDDINIAFNRINKKVMTTQKISGRWDSMYNNKESKRDKDIIHINTAIKPNYSSKDEWDDSPISDADMNWNIYVLLLFRRYKLIDIISITIDKGVYIFSIKITNDVLRVKGDVQDAFIEKIREEEWNYYKESYQLMASAIKHSSRRCWSEMFYETYDKVHEHCSGCKAHLDMNNSDSIEFPLKQPIKSPVVEIALDQKAFLEGQDEIVIIAPGQEKIKIIKTLDAIRMSCLISSPEQLEAYDYFSNVNSRKNTLIVGKHELKELLKKGNYYFISGLVAVIYPTVGKEAFELYKLSKQYLCQKSGIHVVHIIEDNIYFPSLGKNFVDLVSGRVVSYEAIV